MTGFFLGLANSGSCLVYCAPVLFPHVVSRGDGTKPSTFAVGWFLFGRLLGYMTFAVVAYFVGQTLGAKADLVSAVSYTLLAVLFPVFDGLFCETKEGFIQVDCVPGEGSALPPTIEEAIDIDADGASDFAFKLETATDKLTITAIASHVTGTSVVHEYQGERLIRVNLRNPNK